MKLNQERRDADHRLTRSRCWCFRPARIDVALPLLTFIANIMGLIGGAMMCYFHLGITIPAFFAPAVNVLTLSSWTFWLGFIKAPCSPS